MEGESGEKSAQTYWARLKARAAANDPKAIEIIERQRRVAKEASRRKAAEAAKRQSEQLAAEGYDARKAEATPSSCQASSCLDSSTTWRVQLGPRRRSTANPKARGTTAQW